MGLAVLPLAEAVEVLQLLALTLALEALAVPVSAASILGEVNHDAVCNT